MLDEGIIIGTLRRIPLLFTVSPLRINAIAQRLQDPACHRVYDAGATIPSAAAEGSIRILAAKGIIRIGRFPVPVSGVQPLGFELDLEAATMEQTPRRFGGAILPEHPDPATPRIAMCAENPLTVFELGPDVLAEIAQDPGWRGAPQAWARLVESLRIAGMLGVALLLSTLDRRERHALAALMRLERIDPTFFLSSGFWPNATLAVFGQGAAVEVEVSAAGGLTPFKLGYGDVYGFSAMVKWVPGAPRPDRFSLRTLAGGEVAVLPKRGLARAVIRVPTVVNLLRNLYEVWSRMDILVEALHRCPLFEGLPKTALIGLLFHARPLLWRVANHAPPALQVGPGLLIVYEGELMQRPARGCARGVQAVGLEGFLAGRNMAEGLEPRLPTRLVLIPGHAVYSLFLPRSWESDRLLENIARLRGQLEADATARARFEHLPRRPLSVALLEPLGPLPTRVEVRRLQAGLAEAIEQDFEEETAQIWLSEDGSPGALQRALEEHSNAVQALVAAAPGVELGAIREAVDRVVYLNHGNAIAWPDRPVQTTPSLYVALLEQGPVHFTGETPFPPGAVRLRVGEGLTPSQFSVLARAVTDRRVGVALGGGGSWGYAHVAVLMGLRDQGVPIDLISGTSFGSVVGAYYCRAPETGLEQLLAEQWRVQLGNWSNYVSGVLFEQVLDHAFEGATIEGVPVPFIPVGTDLVTGSMYPFLAGPLGRGVRVSGAFAPILPAVFTGSGRFVDGGMSANVPALAVQHDGARLVIASDAVPAPRNRRPWFSLIDHPVLDGALDLLDPRRRLTAYMDGQQALMNTAGELSAAVAPVHFESNRSVSLAALLVGAERVVDNALTDRDFWASLQLAKAKWRALAQPRG